jgi:BirA family transcriptional regulator, biotin operon repressor / biotin---[acetyl-CoA-carboxylase] ligase
MNLNADDIWQRLAFKTKGRLGALQVLASVDSTNEHLLRLSRQAPGMVAGVCLAEEQTSGKGRRGRAWCSPPGANLYLSVLWRYDTAPVSSAVLPLRVAIAIAELLQRFLVERLALKWPNDITCGGKKLGGLLFEARSGSGLPYFLVAGLGLNVRMPSGISIDQPWTDLYRALGEACPDRNELAAAMIDTVADMLVEPDKFNAAELPHAWSYWDGLYGRHVVLQCENGEYAGVASGIDDEGQLLLNIGGGDIRSFPYGEVSVKIPK